MRTALRAMVFLSATLGLTIASASVSLSDEIHWSTDIEKSLQAASQAGKPVLMEFTASWCVYCKRMEKSTFTDPRVAAQIDQQFVAVRVDADKHKDLVKDLEIEGLPAILIVSPDLQIIHRIKGFQTANALLTELNKVPHQNSAPSVARTATAPPSTAANTAARRTQTAERPSTHKDPGFDAVLANEVADTSKRKPVQAASRPVEVPEFADRSVRKPSVTGPTGKKTPPAAAAENEVAQDDAGGFFESLQSQKEQPAPAPKKPARTVSHSQKTSAAFGGTSLVAAVDEHEIRPGSSTHQVTYRDRVLYFQSEEEKSAFQANPNKYWPMLDGECAVALANDEQHVEGQLQFAAVFRKRVWLFSSEANMKEFLADPADTVEAAQEALSAEQR
ncbi:MAG: thioredoxin family protein [Planctomycetaceae bacterium]